MCLSSINKGDNLRAVDIILSLTSRCHHGRSWPDLISQGSDEELLNYSITVNFALKAVSESFPAAPTLPLLIKICREEECKSGSLFICEERLRWAMGADGP